MSDEAIEAQVSAYDAAYVLMSRRTGKDVSEFDHLEQSIIDILTTPLGSRVMMREYGSELFDLLDKPVNAVWKLRFYRATILALNRWEPRLAIRRVTVNASNLANGQVSMDLDAIYLLEGRGVTLKNVTLDFKKDNPNRFELVTV